MPTVGLSDFSAFFPGRSSGPEVAQLEHVKVNLKKEQMMEDAMLATVWKWPKPDTYARCTSFAPSEAEHIGTICFASLNLHTHGRQM